MTALTLALKQHGKGEDRLRLYQKKRCSSEIGAGDARQAHTALITTNIKMERCPHGNRNGEVV